MAIGASGIISVVYFLFYSIISSLHVDDNSTTSHNSKNNNSQEYAKYIAGAFYVCSDIIVGIMLQIFWESVSSSFLLSDKKMSVNSINYGSTFASLLYPTPESFSTLDLNKFLGTCISNTSLEII